MMPLAGGLARSLGKRISKATSKASFSSGTLISMLSEILKLQNDTNLSERR